MDRYLRGALRNLRRTSRTANGMSNVSSSADKPRLVVAEGERLAVRARRNFIRATKLALQMAGEPLPVTHRAFEARILRVARTVRSGLIPDEWRTWETQFHQTSPQGVRPAFRRYCAKLHMALNSGVAPATVASWSERQCDAVDHFFADGCGRTAKIISVAILAHSGKRLPRYPEGAKYYREIVKAPARWRKTYRGYMRR